MSARVSIMRPHALSNATRCRLCRSLENELQSLLKEHIVWLVSAGPFAALHAERQTYPGEVGHQHDANMSSTLSNSLSDGLSGSQLRPRRALRL